MKNMKFGIIGAGGIAHAYVQAFAGSNCCEIVAVADVRLESAKALAEVANVKAYNSHIKLAENEKVDAVIVATPPSTHADIAIYFLERGIPVLCEKPLCISVENAKRMMKAADDNGVVLAMASKFRHSADVIKAKGIVESGTLGEILQFENAFTADIDMSKRWNSTKEISGGGVLIDNGTHSVDIIRYILGPIESVLAVESGRTQGLNVDENVRLLARTASGVVASVDLTWGIQKELPDFIKIYGSTGSLSVGWKHSKYKRNSNPDSITFGNGYDKIDSFRGKLENFAKSVNGKEHPLIRPEDAVASVLVIEAAYRSLESGRWEEVGEVEAVLGGTAAAGK